MPARRRKILFFAEGATLAHVGRPLVLAQALDPEHFDVTFARPASYGWVTAGTSFRVEDLACQDSAVITRRLESGLPLYDFPTLRRYVQDDLALIDRIKPDVVVGDFRISLSVSARLRSTPFLTICDAYWSPERPLRPELPVLAMTRHVPIPIAQGVFRAMAPLALRLHTIPMERLRAHHGLNSLGFDLRRCYTDADFRLFANFPNLYPEIKPGPTADFLGPIAWSPNHKAMPNLDTDAPLIYVTMGSSGDARVLAHLIPALERAKRPVVIATAGKPPPDISGTKHTRLFDFLPGDQACRRACLVVCNGGSPTTNQALAEGVPVLGIARNMDQFLNMRAIERFGAGLLVRADRATDKTLWPAVDSLLTERHFTERAGLLSASAGNLDAASRFAERLHTLRAKT